MPNYVDKTYRVSRTLDEGVDFTTRRAQTLLKESGITGPPFLPEYMASLQRVKRITKEDLGELSGLLLPVPGGFEIKLNAKHSIERQNFSCAHEIGHTFFSEAAGKTLLEKFRRQKGDKAARNWEESCCDVAASELLMPLQIFRRHASRYNFSVHSLVPLSHTFNTSIVPTALRLCDINPRWCFLVHWVTENGNELGSLTSRPTWLTWTGKRVSSRTGRFVFNPKLSSATGSILGACRSDKPTYSSERAIIGSFVGNCEIWSQSFNSGSSRFVISFIFPESESRVDTLI